MTEALERETVIGLLHKLGSELDEDVLEAARQVHAQITAAGMTWEDLLIPEETDEDTDEDTDDSDDMGYQDFEDERAGSAAATAENESESLTLIDKLLAKSGISKDLREELEGYKSDIAEGDFEEADRRYLRAISKRLSKRR